MKYILPCFWHGINLIYPTVCGVCGKISPQGLCKKCEITLKSEMLVKQDSFQREEKKYLSKHIYIAQYRGVIRQKMLEYKFGNCAYLYHFFSYLLLKEKKICVLLKKYDIILPVPVHKKRKEERGYNQCELIAREIIRQKSELKLDTTSLIKKKNNSPQSRLTRNERMQNATGVYELKNNQNIKGKKILLLDDVYTTGSTAKECAKILIEQGEAEMVDILTIAKD